LHRPIIGHYNGSTFLSQNKVTKIYNSKIPSVPRPKMICFRNLAMANGKPMTAVEPDLILFSYACLTGWDAVLNSSRARGPWTSRDSSRHINELELLAALHALESFASEATQISNRIMMDNVTAVNYVNKASGTKSVKSALFHCMQSIYRER
jgi:hypothetical protein